MNEKRVYKRCHGGPIADPSDVQFIVDKVPGLDGFYGASSIERLSTGRALKERVVNFARLRGATKTVHWSLLSKAELGISSYLYLR